MAIDNLLYDSFTDIFEEHKADNKPSDSNKVTNHNDNITSYNENSTSRSNGETLKLFFIHDDELCTQGIFKLCIQDIIKLRI